MQRYPVFYKDVSCGELAVKREGLYLHFQAYVVLHKKVVPRIYLRGLQGEMLLGVAEPKEDEYFLQRSLSAASIEKLGAIQCALVRLREESTEEWQALRQEEFRLCRGFCQRMPGIQSGLFRKKGGVKEIAFPCGERMPFPMPGLFCLAQIREIYGQEYAVFSFDWKGEPIFTKK